MNQLGKLKPSVGGGLGGLPSRKEKNVETYKEEFSFYNTNWITGISNGFINDVRAFTVDEENKIGYVLSTDINTIVSLDLSDLTNIQVLDTYTNTTLLCHTDNSALALDTVNKVLYCTARSSNTSAYYFLAISVVNPRNMYLLSYCGGSNKYPGRDIVLDVARKTAWTNSVVSAGRFYSMDISNPLDVSVRHEYINNEMDAATVMSYDLETKRMVVLSPDSQTVTLLDVSNIYKSTLIASKILGSTTACIIYKNNTLLVQSNDTMYVYDISANSFNLITTVELGLTAYSYHIIDDFTILCVGSSSVIVNIRDMSNIMVTESKIGTGATNLSGTHYITNDKTLMSGYQDKVSSLKLSNIYIKDK